LKWKLIMAIAFIPHQLRDLTAGAAHLEVPAGTVRDAIEALELAFPGIKARLCRDEELSPALQVTIDGVLSHRGIRAKVSPTSEVHFLPAIGGG
jgi:molybdopterin synthase sulfur carrier subunit